MLKALILQALINTLSDPEKQVGVDLDDTVWAVIAAYMAWCNENHGTNYRTKADLQSGKHFSDMSDEEERRKQMERDVAFHLEHDPELIKHAEHALRYIRTLTSLLAISYRCPDELTDVTHGHIQRKLPERLFSDVVLCGHKDKGATVATKKYLILLERCIQVIIEDDGPNAEECAEHGICVILIDWEGEYQHLADHERIQLVSSWEEIEAVFREAADSLSRDMT